MFDLIYEPEPVLWWEFDNVGNGIMLVTLVCLFGKERYDLNHAFSMDAICQAYFPYKVFAMGLKEMYNVLQKTKGDLTCLNLKD